MKKIEAAEKFLTAHLDLFKCPICQQPFADLADRSMVCPNNHRFDLSKKGTLYFLTKKFYGEYDGAMLQARRQILQAGLFDKIIETVAKQLPDQSQTILDIGCGEGTPLNKLIQLRNSRDAGVGFDISKPGIELANNQEQPSFFCVADLAALPFNADSFDIIFDLFSPSAYKEFERVLKPTGKLIKVVPNSNYLMELRHLLYPSDSQNSSYSNQKVVDLFAQHYPNYQRMDLEYQFAIPAGQQANLLLMTPLHWGQGQREVSTTELASLKSITVAVTLLIQTATN